MSTSFSVKDAAYWAGRWCGECQYEVVEDPPCCFGNLPVPFPVEKKE